jgi:hypothetical protein
VFSEACNRGQGLTLCIDPHVREEYSANPLWMDSMRAVAAEAMKEAIVEHKEEFVGLFIGLARTGVNYFERFNGQMTLL